MKTTVGVSQFDICVGDILFIGEGSTDIPFQLAADLSSAQVTATVPVTDVLSGSVFNFQVELTWTATGKARTVNSVDSFRDKALGIRAKTISHRRMAEAVATGTVEGLGINFILNPSDSATILRFNKGTHLVEKPF